ncbi:MAG: PIN domain-containing protein [Chloroflexota bacterium]
MADYLLDTSAILTLIEDENGADRVETILREETVWLPWLVLMECYYITQQERGKAEANQRYALLKELSAVILWEMNEATVLTAARLKAEHRISFADAVIASFAIQHQAILLHKDPEYLSLTKQVQQEQLPYKGKTAKET